LGGVGPYFRSHCGYFNRSVLVDALVAQALTSKRFFFHRQGGCYPPGFFSRGFWGTKTLVQLRRGVFRELPLEGKYSSGPRQFWERLGGISTISFSGGGRIKGGGGKPYLHPSWRGYNPTGGTISAQQRGRSNVIHHKRIGVAPTRNNAGAAHTRGDTPQRRR